MKWYRDWIEHRRALKSIKALRRCIKAAQELAVIQAECGKKYEENLVAPSKLKGKTIGVIKNGRLETLISKEELVKILNGRVKF